MKNKLLVLILIFQYTQLLSQTTVGLIQHNIETLDNGYVLFSPISSNNSYLIDKCGKQVHSWPSTYKPGQSAYILNDGSLLRTGNTNNTSFVAGGRGGIIEKIDWNGNVTWSYTISSSTECQHHDIKPMPNGNVLAIVWEEKSDTDAIANGRNPALTTFKVWSEKIIEIQPVGATGGVIVWEWHVWDHLVQDFDNTKSNFGSISDNPQLLNLNFEANANITTGKDWLHLNSIDYNPVLDQILISSHSFNEIWVVDHSTSTAQAASHSGGNSNKGGDILFRWGNPKAYNVGTTTQFFGQHNAHWIEPGLPYENQIMVFNNGNGRTGGNYTTVEIINPPVNGFNYTSTLPYMPNSTSWIYNSGNPNNLYAQNISGAQQLSNGNVLICSGPTGTFIEIDSIGNTVWKYINPVSNAGILNQGTAPTQNQVFRCSFYPESFIGFNGHTLVTNNILENTNTVSDSCNLTSNINDNFSLENISVFPNPTKDFINIQLNELILNDLNIEIFNSIGELVQQFKINIGTKNAQIKLNSLNTGFYLVRISSKNKSFSHKIIVNEN